MRVIRFAMIPLLLTGGLAVALDGRAPAFFPDDPIAVFPEPADASNVKPRAASQGFDFVENSFLQPGERANRRAGNLNTVDEVPDSSWFTNRIGARPLSIEEIRRGPDQSAGPAPGQWKLILGDATGVTPGFRIRDASGQLYFIKLDQPKNPELSTGAEAVSTKIFHALGYNVPENYIVSFTRSMLDLSEAQITGAEGRRRRMTGDDLDVLLSKAAQKADGSYRVIASRAIDGTILGPFRYYGMVPDDPNDIVPHEHRRELRGLRVFSAWVNHMDSRGINSLDTLVDVGARKVVKHYLLDFGSTLGSAAIAVKSRRSGNAYLWDFGESMAALATFGLYLPRWVFTDYPMQDLPAVGRFEGDAFQPENWVPHYPNPAFDNARADDTFWAARRIMAFSDEAIRALVEAGQYSDPRATEYLTQVLIKRRDKIGRAWLTSVNPVVDVALDSGTLRFANAAVAAGVAEPPREYSVSWATLDNATNTRRPEGAAVTTTTTSATPPSTVTGGGSQYIQADIAAIHDNFPSWRTPVRVTFRRDGSSWKTVGLERLPEGDVKPVS